MSSAVQGIRLGWAISEVRGRCRPDRPPPPSAPQLPRGDHVLPLTEERSQSELAVAASRLLLDLAIPVVDPAMKPRHRRKAAVQTLSKDVDALRRQLVCQSGRIGLGSEELVKVWKRLAEALYRRDAAI